MSDNKRQGSKYPKCSGLLRKRRSGPIKFTIIIGLIVAISAYFSVTQIGFSDEHTRICGQEEHTHSTSCYSQPSLKCELGEADGHVHSDGCYQTALICGSSEHTHNTDCYSSGKTPNTQDPTEAPVSDEGTTDPAQSSHGSYGTPDSDETVIDDAGTPGSGGPATANGNVSDTRGPTEGGEESPDPAEGSGEAELTGQEEENEAGDGRPGIRDVNPLDASDLSSYSPNAPIAVIKIPVAKNINGDGALEALREDSTYHFEIKIEKLANPNAMTGTLVDSKILTAADFGTGQRAEVILTVNITEYGTHYYRISETQDTGGDFWLFDTNSYVVKVEADASGSVIVTYATNGKPLGGVSITTSHSRTPGYTLPIPPYSVLHRDTYGSFTGINYGWFLFRVQSTNVSSFNALCADIRIAAPNEETIVVPVSNRSSSKLESALAFSLFDSTVGARLTLDEFNDLFGFDGDQLEKINDARIRRGMVQYAIWFYEMKYLSMELGWSSESDWALDKPSQWPTAHPDPFFTDPDSGRYHNFDGMFQHNSENHYDHIMRMLSVIEQLTKASSSVPTGQAITSLSFNYTPVAGSASSGRIDVTRSGYVPSTPHDLILSWTGGGSDITVKSFDSSNTARDSNTESGGSKRDYIKVRPGDIITVTDMAGEVTFTLSDPLFYLAGNSIRGILFSLDTVPEPKSDTPYQRLISGYAQFVKLSISKTIGGDMPPFNNNYTSFELPVTVGIGIDQYIITGAVLTLVSGIALFTSGVRPIREGVGERKAWRLSSTKKRRK